MTDRCARCEGTGIEAMYYLNKGWRHVPCSGCATAAQWSSDVALVQPEAALPLNDRSTEAAGPS